MNDLLTFFRNRKQDCGKEWQMKVETESREIFVLFYSKSPLSKSSYLSSLRSNAPTAYPQYRENLIQEIQKNGGGLLVEAKFLDRGCEVSFLVLITEDQNDTCQPPQNVFYIEYGGHLEERPLTGEPLSLPQFAHIVLPVDAEAEENFRFFRKYSSWFPADFETVMLNLLRKPSLDLRLERLERIIDDKFPSSTPWHEKFLLFKKPASKKLNTSSDRDLITFKKWLFRLFIVILISAYSYFIYRVIDGYINLNNPIQKTQPEVNEYQIHNPPLSSGVPAKNEDKGAPDSQVLVVNKDKDRESSSEIKTNMNLANSINTFMDKFKSKNNADRRLQRIWDIYFKSQATGPINAKKADELLTDKSFLWGLAKLHAVIAAKEAGTPLSSDKFLDSVKEWTTTVEIFSELYKNNAYPSISDIDFPVGLIL